MAVAGGAQAGVAEVPGGVVGLLERAQHERAERLAPVTGASHVLLDPPRDLAEELGGLRRGHVLRATAGVGTSSVASWSARRSTRCGLGPLVHAIQARHRALGEQRGDSLVGGDHQVLDQPVGLGLHAGADRDDVAALVELELGLLGVDDERAAALASPLQRARPRARGTQRCPPTARRRARCRRRCDRPARSPGARRSGSASDRRRRA